jgi:hypothetical protein
VQLNKLFKWHLERDRYTETRIATERHVNMTLLNNTKKNPTYMHLFIFTPMRFDLKADHFQGVFIAK